VAVQSAVDKNSEKSTKPPEIVAKPPPPPKSQSAPAPKTQEQPKAKATQERPRLKPAEPTRAQGLRTAYELEAADQATKAPAPIHTRRLTCGNEFPAYEFEGRGRVRCHK